MGVLGTIFGIAVLLAIGWAISKARDGFWKGANRHVLARGQHSEGQHLTQEHLTIRTAVAPNALQEQIVNGLALPADMPVAFHAELFQGPIRPGYVEFGSGTKIKTRFTAAMKITATDGGSELTYTVLRWILVDGIVAGITQMKFLRRRIEEEARKADPAAVVTVRMETPEARR